MDHQQLAELDSLSVNGPLDVKQGIVSGLFGLFPSTVIICLSHSLDQHETASLLHILFHRASSVNSLSQTVSDSI